MRKREIHQDFWRSLDISNLGYFERLLFMALWGAADREGLVLNRADRIKADAFPLDDKTTITGIAEGIQSLAVSGLIEVLSASNGDKQTCIHIVNFKKYQRIHPNEAKSVLKCNYIPGNVVECGEMSLMPFRPVMPIKPSCPPKAPRKRVAGESDEMLASVGEVVEHLNAVTGRGFGRDKANEHIIRALQTGATTAECKQVIDYLWETWSPEWRSRINKTTPFRKANFDRYLDEARAGRAQAATAPADQPIPREVIANLEFEIADGADVEAWLSRQPPAWIPVLRERASRMVSAGR